MSTSHSPSSWERQGHHFEQKILSKKALELADINCTLTECAFGRGMALNSSESLHISSRQPQSQKHLNWKSRQKTSHQLPAVEGLLWSRQRVWLPFFGSGLDPAG